MKWATIFKSIAKSLLLLTFFTPFIVTTFSVFPFEYGKTIFYTTLLQFASIFFVLYVLVDFNSALAEIKSRFSGKRNLVLCAALLFLVSMAVSTIFAEVPYIAFWGNVDRNEGLIAFLYHAVFIVLSFILFNKTDWYLYFCGLLVSVILLCVVAWMQYLGVSANFIIRIRPQAQPGSFAGNPVYLSSFLITFLVFTASLFTISDLRKKFFLTVGIGLSIIGTILITGIRGELLGLIAALGVLVIYGIFKSPHKIVKRAAVGAVIALLVFVGVFLATKSNPFWLKIPTIGRFATLSTQTNSYITRVFTTQAALKGFKENWFLGSGQESFNVIFNRHGSPKVAEYGDDWFDRAHNKLLDIIVYQGIVGLVAYFFLFGVLVYTFRKKILFVALLAAYFVQSLFIFDTNLTYLVLVALIAYAAQTYIKHPDSPDSEDQKLPAAHLSPVARNVIKTALVLAIPAVFAVFVLVNVRTIKQQLLFEKVLSLPQFEQRAALLHDLFYPFNHAQPRVRMFVNQMLREWKTVQRPGGVDAALLGAQALEEVLRYDPLEVRYHMRLAEAYLELGAVDNKHYEKAEHYAREGIKLAPQQHKLYYLLNFILSRQARYDEAIDVARRAIALSPNNARSHLYLALTEFGAADAKVNPYFDAGDSKFQEYLKEGVESLYTTHELASTQFNGEKMPANGDTGNVQYRLFERSDFNNFVVLLSRVGDSELLLKVANIGLFVHANDQQMYQYILAWHVFDKNPEKVAEILQRIKAAPFAWQLPIADWEKFAQEAKWDELKKHPFIGKFVVLFEIPPIGIDSTAR